MNNEIMNTIDYTQKLIEDITNSKKRSIRFNTPINMNVEIRVDTEYGIDFTMCDIAIQRFSLKKNYFGEYKILVANGRYNITHTRITKESYDEIQKRISQKL